MPARLVAALAALACALSLGACATTGGLSGRDAQAVAGRTYVLAGASSGFGRGVAVKLGGYKANVVLAARRGDLLEEVAAEVRAAGGQPLVVVTDVSDPAQVERLAQAAVSRFGRIDAWMNIAGIGAIGRFWDIPVADHARLIDINVNGVIYGSHAALRQFRSQGSGVLVNVGSIDSEVPLAYQASYSASKAAVLSLGRALNEELRLNGPKGVRVATIMPWATDTPWWTHAANYSGGTPRMAMIDGPEIVVDAMIRASLRPREEMPTGWKAHAANLSHHIAPDITETFAANVAHRYQLETAPPAPPTSGSLHRATPEGRGVEGGLRERMRREDEARKAAASAR